VPSKRLTAPSVDHLRTTKPQEDYWDTITPGFGVRVTKGGTRTFMVMVRTLERGQWKKRRIKIGRVGDTLPDNPEKVLDLAEARRRAKEVIAAATDGQDPKAKLETPPDVQRVERSADCFANVRDEFLRRYRTKQKTKPRPRTLEEMRRCISGDRFETWDDRPIADITKQDVRELLDGIIDEGHDAHANKTLTVLKMLFNWAYDHDKVRDVPTDRIKPPGAEASRERTLASTELATIWNAARGKGGPAGNVYGDIVRVLMLTGQRRNEVAQMQWSEIDFDRRVWEMPGSRTKNKRPHLVPLSSPVLAILRRQQKEQATLPEATTWVFTTNGETPFSGWSRSKQRLDHRAKVDDWRLHDLRRTMVTDMNEKLQVLPHVVEAIVNHVTGAAKQGAAGVYNRALYIDHRRRALERWGRLVLKAVAEARRHG
jgi:integrase